MIKVNTCNAGGLNPLIPAMVALCNAPVGESLEIVMDNAEVFRDLKEYLSSQDIGFREIYDGEQMTLQFTIHKKIMP